MEPISGEDNLDSHYLEAEFFIFSSKPIEGPTEELKHFKEVFDFSKLDPPHELYSENKNKLLEK